MSLILDGPKSGHMSLSPHAASHVRANSDWVQGNNTAVPQPPPQRQQQQQLELTALQQEYYERWFVRPQQQVRVCIPMILVTRAA